MANPKRRTTGQISGENVVIGVAWMYYQDGMNQKDIADKLGISRATVVNYLQEARERGYIRTPSYAQVTEKIYSSASGRWQRYRNYMNEVLPILEPWVQKYDYSLD